MDVAIQGCLWAIWGLTSAVDSPKGARFHMLLLFMSLICTGIGRAWRLFAWSFLSLSMSSNISFRPASGLLRPTDQAWRRRYWSFNYPCQVLCFLDIVGFGICCMRCCLWTSPIFSSSIRALVRLDISSIQVWAIFAGSSPPRKSICFGILMRSLPMVKCFNRGHCWWLIH
jgi:hypothetical protein